MGPNESLFSNLFHYQQIFELYIVNSDIKSFLSVGLLKDPPGFFGTLERRVLEEQ